ncbi:MAG: B12-binding domain-containing radical SAM protein [Candidatus Muirbacterium halophilum]|nr:B12-binding domain-containing radical SAM protein [Candidatus Muirbacterium halophilum]MCK9475942.1 B12-binding domain-containing radical SAM protein [Candidatus Muirbacterium halophilum]
MKILLTAIHSRFSQVSLAIPYLFANIDSKFDKNIIEFNINMEIDSILKTIISQNADIVCFSCYIWNIDITLQICDVLKKILPNTIIVLGGPEVSYNCREILENNYIDYIISGEGDISFAKLVNAIDSKDYYPDIDGLCYKKDKNLIIKSPAVVENLDCLKLPWTDRLINKDKNFIYYETSRGCPFSCRYCISGISNDVRNYSIQNVKKIIDIIVNYDFSTFRCIDRTFNLDINRAITILEYILQKRRPNQLFQFEIKADLLNDDFFEFLKKIPKGVFQFEIGVQSLDENVLKTSGRKENLEKLYDNMKKIINSKKIYEHIDLIIGLPNEKFYNFKFAINKILNLMPHKLQINTLKLLKGSYFYENKEKFNIIAWNKAPYEVIKTVSMSIEQISYFDDISKMINIFYNSEYIFNTLRYIADNYGIFDFFDEILKFFKLNGLKFHSVSRINVFRIVYQVIKQNKNYNFNELSNILNMDFVESSKDFKANDIERIANESFLNKIDNNVINTKNTNFDNINNVDNIDFNSNARFKLSKTVFIYDKIKFPKEIPNFNNFCIYYFDFINNSNSWIDDKKNSDIILNLFKKSGQSIEDIENNINYKISIDVFKNLFSKKIINFI